MGFISDYLRLERTGDRVLQAGLTKIGDAKIHVNRWARRLRERVDEAHEMRE